MLALAYALRERGHTVVFSAPSNFVAWVRAHGFDAESNGIDVEAVLTEPGADFHSLRWQMRHLAELTASLFESVARAAEGADLIVGSGVQMASASVAESRDIPSAMAVFCPCAVPSADAPPPTVKVHTLPRWINRLLWDVGGPIVSWALRSQINRGRSTLGLRAVDDVLRHLMGDRVLVAADRDLGPLGADAPPKAVATDAWIFEQNDAALDPSVEAFLGMDPAPVYIGFGSMVARKVPHLAEAAVEAARAIGRPAIISGGWAGLDRHVAPAADLFVAGPLPHARVFPRVAAVIHHGGAGTTTAAARGGAPQVILPHILDQFYWAHRVAQLGLGPRGIPVNLVTADTLAERVEAAVEDPRVRARARSLAPAIRARNGAPAAVELLERLVSSA